MECADCGERPAAVFIRRSGGDLALCEACARSRGIMAGSGGLDIRLEGLFGAISSERPKTLSCPSCGIELSSLAREGRLGCPGCVEAFRPEIERLLASRDAALRGSKGPQPELADRWPAPRAPVLPRAGARFPLNLPAFSAFGAPGPEDDVVLLCVARASRALEGRPFPSSPAAGPSPSRGRILEILNGFPGWSLRSLADLEEPELLALRELASLPPSFASDPQACLAASSDSPLCALEDETDHLRAFARLPGLDACAAAGLALGLADRVDEALAGSGGPSFARDPELGWLCADIEELGTGLLVSATVHLPALAMAGLQDRLFRALMAEGIQIRGAYAEASASTGAVFELAATGAAGGSAREIAAALERAARQAAAAERRAREEIARRESEALMDAAGRALGILSNARRVGLEESSALISSLRLASLAGMLRGADARRLGGLLGLLGPGGVAAASASSAVVVASIDPKAGADHRVGGGRDAARSRFLKGEVAAFALA